MWAYRTSGTTVYLISAQVFPSDERKPVDLAKFLMATTPLPALRLSTIPFTLQRAMVGGLCFFSHLITIKNDKCGMNTRLTVVGRGGCRCLG